MIGEPRHFREKLGNHPEFPFLQKINGVSTSGAFIAAINSSDNQTRFAREFKAFDLLLHNAGFSNGYKDLSETNVMDTHVARGTIGNLGFYDQKKDLISYIFVKLNPAAEDAAGIGAWKLTNESGCYLYILHTCGNAFYPGDNKAEHLANLAKNCCKSIVLEEKNQAMDIKNDSVKRPVHILVDFYQARLIYRGRHAQNPGSNYDTAVRLIHHFDTVTSVTDLRASSLKIQVHAKSVSLTLCEDTVVPFDPFITVDSAGTGADQGPLEYKYADTVFVHDSLIRASCQMRWEISADGGIAFNTIPRFDNATAHSQTNGGHQAGEFAISRIFNHWFQAGLSATYIILSYQDDILYPGTVAGTYNKIYLGRPSVPLQIFAKFTIGKPIGFQGNVSFSAGYALATHGRIENSGVLLTTKPNFQNGLTAGGKLGLAYFFTCKFGLGLSVDGQYFANRNNAINYHPFALPVLAGIRFRW